MEQQQHGFSNLTPRAGSARLQKSAESLLSALQLMSISKISTQNYGSSHFGPFYISRKNFPIGGRPRIHSDRSDRPENFQLYFCLFERIIYIFFNNHM